jgi:uncharacterized membrane protein
MSDADADVEIEEPRVPAWVIWSTFVLSLAGLAISVYLTIEHYRPALLYCPATGAVDCGAVTTSPWSKVFGIYVSYPGGLFFVAMTLLNLPAAWRSSSEAIRLGRLGLSVAGVVFVFYLIWAEVARIHKICLWCTGVHVITLALFAIVVWTAMGFSDGDLEEDPEDE